MPHQLHQFPEAGTLRGRHRVPGVSQVVEMQFRQADRFPGPTLISLSLTRVAEAPIRLRWPE
jgi:hypothetical protein